MERLNMSYKQAFGAIYAISRYLDDKDENALRERFSPEVGEYNRGLRAGRCEVIEDVSRILKQYQKETK